MKRALGYFRVSTVRQATERTVSLPVQRERFLAFCERHGYTVVGEYTDVLSGRRDDRTQYQAMLERCEHGETDAIVTMFLDRFGRNTDEILLRTITLRRLGIVIECTDEDISNPLIALVQAWKAGEESKRIGERTRAGIVGKLRAGSHFGRVGMGWRRERDEHGHARLVLHEPEAALIRRMATLLTEDGYTLRRIAQTLNAEGHRRRRGQEWTASTVGPLLRRPSNAGLLVYGAQHQRYNKDGAKEQATLAVPAIFSPELARALQERLALNRGLPKGHSRTSYHLLAGLIRCGVCGAPVVGTGHPTKDAPGRTVYYVCERYRDLRSCSARQYYRHQALEGAVLEALIAAADAQAAAAALPSSAPARDYAAEEGVLTADLRALERETQDQYDLYRDGVLDREAFRVVNARIAAERTAARQRGAALASERQAEERRLARITTLPQRARDLAETFDGLALPARKALLQELVERVTVRPSEPGEPADLTIAFRL